MSGKPSHIGEMVKPQPVKPDHQQPSKANILIVSVVMTSTSLQVVRLAAYLRCACLVNSTQLHSFSTMTSIEVKLSVLCAIACCLIITLN